MVAMWLPIAGLLLLAGCSSLLGYDDVTFDEGARGGSGGVANGGASGEATGGAPAAGSAGGPSAGGASGASGEPGAGGSPAASGGSSGTDPYAEARQTCIDHINELRATKGLPPYQRWTEGEECADLQATDDQQTGKPHGAWSSRKFGCDGGSAQNECLGGGATGIVGCLNMMWAEKDLPGCSGCDQCTSQSGCADCDFYGTTTGDVCGHYLNMRATWFSMAACGFSSGGGWAAINFR
jgi:hypothetical protein